MKNYRNLLSPLSAAIFLVLLLVLHGLPALSQVNALFQMDGSNSGSNPSESLVKNGDYLYGMTEFGGVHYKGTLYRIKTDGSNFQKLLDFDGGNSGSHPKGSLFVLGSHLYGMTVQGGMNDMGIIFRIQMDGSGFEKLMDFDGAQRGSNPNSSFYYDGSFLYGMTATGGVNDDGVLFKIAPNGSNYMKLLDFSGAAKGRNPEGPLVSDGTYLYGVTPLGGSSNLGTIFRIKPDGTSFSKLRNINGGSMGSTPRGSLVYDGDSFYGMTSFGGTNNNGVLFKYTVGTNTYTPLVDFQGGTDGRTPTNSLVLNDNYLVGMTGYGGLHDHGTIFRILPDGTGYQKLFDFEGAVNGRTPNGVLLFDGNLAYGTTESGGQNDLGVVFRYDVPAQLMTESVNEGLLIYTNPSQGKLAISLPIGGIKLVEIRTLRGDLIYQENHLFENNRPALMDLSSLPSGMYFVQIDTYRGKLQIH